MKQRRARRSLAWWSWLLLLSALGFTYAGYRYGHQEWEKAPKDYLTSAVVTVNIREPFKVRGVQSADVGLLDVNQTKVLQAIESLDGLGQIVSDLSLDDRWVMSVDEAIQTLRTSLELDLLKEKDELSIIVRRHDPVEAAELANEIAEMTPDLIASIDQEQIIALGREKLEADLRPVIEAQEEAFEKLKDVFAANEIPVEPREDMDMSVFLEIPEIRQAHFAWEDAGKDLATARNGQRQFERYLEKELKPSFVSQKAGVPPGPIGPDPAGFHQQFALYGLTLGLAVGALLMFLCWKIFP